LTVSLPAATIDAGNGINPDVDAQTQISALAQSGHPHALDQRLLSGVKRTSVGLS